MSELRPVIAEHADQSYSLYPDIETHVEIVDEAGFAGFDPTGDDILEAYITEKGHRPATDEEMADFGALALRTATYYHELFELATEEMDLFGIEEEDLREVGGALSLDVEHSYQVWSRLAPLRRSSPTE